MPAPAPLTQPAATEEVEDSAGSSSEPLTRCAIYLDGSPVVLPQVSAALSGTAR